MTPITVDVLRGLDACESGIADFAAAFPGGLVPASDPTERAEQARRIAEARLCIDWASEHLLPEAQLAEYERVRAAALAEIERARAAALADFERARAAALADFARVRAAAWDEYDRVRAAAFLAAYAVEVGP